MANSRRLSILLALQTALRAILGASYHYPVTDPDNVSLDVTMNLMTVSGADVPLYMIEPTPEGDKDFHPGMHMVERFRINIFARYDAAHADAGARAQVWEDLAADIERALTVDVTLGGLVYDTRVLVPQPFVGTGSPIVILVQPIEVRVHREYGVPE